MDLHPANYTVPRWADVHATVVRFDVDALRDAVAKVLERGGDDDALWEATRAQVGPWFGVHGWWIGNESFGSCWCHSPLASRNKRKGAQTAAVAWVVHEVTLLVDFVRALDDLFAGVRDHDTARAVARGFDALVDEVATRTQCNESWYRYVVACIPWLFDALGIRRGRQLQALLERTMGCVFSSWVRPSPDAARAMARELATYAESQGRRASTAPAPRPHPPRTAVRLPMNGSAEVARAIADQIAVGRDARAAPPGSPR